MSRQLELVAAERVVLGKKVGALRRQGIVPGNVYGHDQPSSPVQVSAMALRRLLARGGNNVIALKVGSQPPIQALIKQVQHNAITDQMTHVEFLRLGVSEKLRTLVQLKFVNGAKGTGSMANATVLRSLQEVMVECLPAHLPDSIEVDISSLSEVGAVIRVGDLKVDEGVTIVTDHSDMVAGLHQQTRVEKPEGEESPANVTPPATHAGRED